jgi:uncharacterized protein YfaS (alpha-2-macroglobulin family)
MLPTGFSSTFSTQAPSLAPGASATVTWTVTSPTTAAAQLFSIQAKTTHGADATLAATAQASYGVNAAFSVTVRTDRTAYAAGTTVIVTVDALSGGVGVNGATVSVRVTDPRARVSTFAATTNASGRATVTFALPRNARVGTWSVGASATSGLGSGSASTTFTVR